MKEYNETRTEIKAEFKTEIKNHHSSKEPALQKTMSVPEMRKLLGLKKTESYWLVHRGFFKTEIIGGMMRVNIESFEKWYANKVKHKKVNGEEPGRELISKQVERVSRNAVEALNSKEIILTFHSTKKNNKTARVLKTPKTESSARKVFIPRTVAGYLAELKSEQDEIKEALGSEYQDYKLVMATTFGLPIGDSYLRTKMQDIIDELGLPDVVFHSLRHTSVTYKLKLSGGDIKSVQGDSGERLLGCHAPKEH